MRYRDIGSSLVLLLIGILILPQSLRLGVGSWMIPGPGFLPFWAGVALSLLALAIFLSALVRKVFEIAPRFWPRLDSGKYVCLVSFSLIGYNFLWTQVGFSITTFLFMGFLFRIVGKHPWRVSLGGAALTSLLAYVFFNTFLKSHLPQGLVGF